MTYTTQDARAVAKVGFRPLSMARLAHGPSPVTLVSFPYPSDDGSGLRVLVKRIPGEQAFEVNLAEVYLDDTPPTQGPRGQEAQAAGSLVK